MAQEKSLRPLSTDRPDTTESPFTVDAGHFQFELEMAAYTRNGSEDSFTLGELNAKFGLNACTDIQFVVPIYEHAVGGSEGLGDVQVRVKYNIFGNNGGDTALAIMPFVQIPTGADGVGSEEFEGGIIFPYGFEGPWGWGFGVQAEIDLVSNEVGNGHHFSFLTSATAAHDLTESLGCFFELVGIFGEGREATTEYYFNTGLTWGMTETVQLDGGIRAGLTDDSDDLTPFIGASVKF
ncbi:MAG: transporter [Armatimonadetes bacterium]|nr:transporter [Akkermansiaceae bacterium]